jgi:hypothetical protein
MNENGSIWRFSLSAMAVGRVTPLLAEEDIPPDMTASLRAWLGTGTIGHLTDCCVCLSLWIALPLAVFTSNGFLGIAVHWLALSGVSCLLEKSTSNATRELTRLEFVKGDAPCAAVKREAI